MPAKKTATKKTVAKKETAKKPVAKKPVAKKAAPAKKAAAPKKATKKTAAAKKPAAVKVVKKSVQEYEDIIRWKKGEAHAINQLYIEVNAKDLLTEVEAGVSNLSTVCKAILNCMLEGDGFIVEPSSKTKVSETLTVRYYCDNLAESRKKYFE